MPRPATRFWFDLHSLVGVLFGLILFLTCWTGTSAVFSREIDWMLNPMVRAEHNIETPRWGAYERSIEAHFPDARIISIHRPDGAGFAVEALIDLPDQSYVRVYLDPATAHVRGTTSFFNVQRFFRSLHRSMFDVWGIGKWVVVAMVVPLLFAALAPFLFYRKWRRGLFRLNLKAGWKVAMSDAHKLVGLWSLWFAALIGVTGIWYAAEYLGADFGHPPAAEAPALPQDVEPPAELPLDQLVQDARRAWPGLDIRTVYFPDGEGEGVVFSGQDGSLLVRESANQLLLTRHDGQIVSRQDAASLGWPARWVDTADELHFGTFGGLWTKALWAIFGLGLSSLCLSGAYLHFRRRLAQGDRARWPTTSAAVTATFMLLVATAVAGWEEIRSYGASIDGVQQMPVIDGATADFLILWVGLTGAVLLVWMLALVRPHAVRVPKLPALDLPPLDLQEVATLPLDLRKA